MEQKKPVPQRDEPKNMSAIPLFYAVRTIYTFSFNAGSYASVYSLEAFGDGLRGDLIQPYPTASHLTAAL